MTTTSSPPPATPSRTRRVIAITLAIIAALVVAFFVFASLYADWLWFDQLGFTEVLLTQWIARVVMFVVGFLGMAVPVWLSIQLAYRLRPVYARLSSQLDRYQEVVEPLRRLAMWGIPVFFGFFAGFAASAQWETTWLWFNGVATDDHRSRVPSRHRLLHVRHAVLERADRLRLGGAADLPARHRTRRRTCTARCASASASCASRSPRASSSR